MMGAISGYLLDGSCCGLHFRNQSISQPGSLSVVIQDRFRDLCISRFVEPRLHPRGRASNLAKTFSDAIEFAVPAFSC
jgi:hypothetical protein